MIDHLLSILETLDEISTHTHNVEILEFFFLLIGWCFI